MKTVIQRVKSASVTVDGQLISSIGKGLLVFAAIGKDDTKKEAESMASKILKAKFWDDAEGGRWKHNVQDISGEVLCVSQFTLYASMKKGNKPDFHHAAPPQKGRELYDIFIGQVRKLYQEEKVKDGVFQAMMDVGIVNDGPVSPSPSPPSTPLDSSAPASPVLSPDSPRNPPTSHIPTTPCIGVDFTCLDEVVTIEIETNPPEMKDPSGFPPEDGETHKGKIQSTFEYPASLLE
ncbi:related to aminoacyl-tRNA hydrolase [Ramularia collo-cygni]|uniref:D-aminoacyl-tRNA deacylase n=1 Tax=Ramularia collo-cygni TaxID=112498 RepID=A0A2D3VJR6_9PEZI|nr:related to aminoacyl-tRNA hydrolase [Ramularia collo-cygni]CZT22349.1 related to aminoacyl-tRNA hydrolase [Ramularia collo-cygni]